MTENELKKEIMKKYYKSIAKYHKFNFLRKRKGRPRKDRPLFFVFKDIRFTGLINPCNGEKLCIKTLIYTPFYYPSRDGLAREFHLN